MIEIEFFGEGPSPKEVSEHYVVGGELPHFRERYRGEYGDMYRANGRLMGSMILGEVAGRSLEEVVAEHAPGSFEMEEGDVLGPVALGGEVGIIPGVAIWKQRPSLPN